MFETLKEIYYETTGNYELDLQPKMVIDRDLGLSSYGKIQLICAIEDYFEIEIPNKELRHFKKVNDIVEYLDKII